MLGLVVYVSFVYRGCFTVGFICQYYNQVIGWKLKRLVHTGMLYVEQDIKQQQDVFCVTQSLYAFKRHLKTLFSSF